MNVIPAPVSELDLHAWADGALSPERAGLVEDWLRAHPAAAEEVRHWRLQADALRLLYPLPDADSMSPALRRSLARAAGGPAAPPAAAPSLAASAARRLGGLAAALVLALAVGAAVALHIARGPDGLAERALRLHEEFLHATAEPASLAGVGSAGPDLSEAGFALRAVRTVPGQAAGYSYKAPDGARFTLVMADHRQIRDEVRFLQRGDITLFGWRDARTAFVLVGTGLGSRLLAVAHLVDAGFGRQSPERAGAMAARPEAGRPGGVRPASHHRM